MREHRRNTRGHRGELCPTPLLYPDDDLAVAGLSLLRRHWKLSEAQASKAAPVTSRRSVPDFLSMDEREWDADGEALSRGERREVPAGRHIRSKRMCPRVVSNPRGLAPQAGWTRASWAPCNVNNPLPRSRLPSCPAAPTRYPGAAGSLNKGAAAPPPAAAAGYGLYEPTPAYAGASAFANGASYDTGGHANGSSANGGRHGAPPARTPSGSAAPNAPAWLRAGHQGDMQEETPHAAGSGAAGGYGGAAAAVDHEPAPPADLHQVMPAPYSVMPAERALSAGSRFRADAAAFMPKAAVAAPASPPPQQKPATAAAAAEEEAEAEAHEEAPPASPPRAVAAPAVE